MTIYRDADGKALQPCPWRGCDRYKTTQLDSPLCDMHNIQVWAHTQNLIDSGVTPEQISPTPKRPPHPGYVYYLRIGDHIKIGFAKNIERRLRNYPPNAELLTFQRGTIKDEQRIHHQFLAHRIAGREWYSEAPEILAHIAQLEEDCPHYHVDPWANRNQNKQPVSVRGWSGKR